jgi:N-methylhydantoinase B/oxoprolinase/acetone carboxylase alpha subunit
MYMHRLVSISEEGRIALQRVCASPIVVQGGECMSAFYAADGTTIHTASGHLRFAAGCEDAVKAILDAYPEIRASMMVTSSISTIPMSPRRMSMIR